MNLLITGAWQDAKEHIPRIAKLHDVLFLQTEQDPLPCDPGWVEGVICNGFFIHHPIEQFSHLKYIQLTSAGLDRVPVDYIASAGIEIHNARGVYSIPMAEFCVGGLLSIYKSMNLFYDQQKNHQWIKHRDLRELDGQTVVILGCGSVGTECARRLKAFGCTIIGVDIDIRDDIAYDLIYPLDKLKNILPIADVVIISLPLTEATKGLIDRHELNLIHGVLINISRGSVVDQSALEEWKGEAILDVFEEEPLAPDSKLWSKEGFLIYPHNSFIGDKNINRLNDLIIKNLREWEAKGK